MIGFFLKLKRIHLLAYSLILLWVVPVHAQNFPGGSGGGEDTKPLPSSYRQHLIIKNVLSGKKKAEKFDLLKLSDPKLYAQFQLIEKKVEDFLALTKKSIAKNCKGRDRIKSIEDLHNLMVKKQFDYWVEMKQQFLNCTPGQDQELFSCFFKDARPELHALALMPDLKLYLVFRNEWKSESADHFVTMLKRIDQNLKPAFVEPAK